METYIAYFDETGDDGESTSSSDHFILTSIYMPATVWQENFNRIRELRYRLNKEYGFHVSQELHTKNLLTDKNPYREYGWMPEEKREIIKAFALAVSTMDISVVNVIIDKTRFINENYKVLDNALKYNIQRIENDSHGMWNYIIVTDKGRLPPMRKTARAIRASNPIQSRYTDGYSNQPVSGLIEDILEKDSQESYFIQICDLISYFVHLYFISVLKAEALPNRVMRILDVSFVKSFMATLKNAGILNLKASRNDYGLVIYPR
jgi:hypothetical protein